VNYRKAYSIIFPIFATKHIFNMLNKVIFPVILLVLLVFQGCKFISEDNVTISGTLTNLPDTKLLIYQILPAGKPLIDSVSTDANGNFTVSLTIEKAGYYTLMRNSADEITLVISPGENIVLNADGSNFRNTYTVAGSKDSELLAVFNRFTMANLRQVDSLSGVFAESRMKPDFQLIKNSLDSAYMQIFNNQKAKVIEFINEHPGSLASLLVISENFGPNPLLSEKTHPELYLKLDSALMLAHPENSLVNSLHLRMLDFRAEMDDMKVRDSLLKPGMPAPEIVLPNTTGKEISLSSLKGKLVLVYFWSSWNALSRQTNMNLSTLYNKFHSRGFEIYAVSVDSDADLWQKACLIDRAYWVNVIDTKGLASEFSKTYGVSELPDMILVAGDGTIIARKPEFNELESLIKMNL
jgi:thiol-disulfide isomerase/thioredoxin